MNTETLIISQLLINDEYSRKVLPHLKEEYFSSVAEKNFLKIYSRFYSKHNKIPSKQAILIEIENLKSSADVYTSMIELVSSTVEFDESLEWLIDETEKYCKERALFNALRDSVLIIDGASKSKISKDGIPAMLQEALAVCFDTTVGHNYIDDSEDRFDYYHATENRIKTGIPEFDKITKGGFPRKTLNVFLAPPHGGKSMVMTNLASGSLKSGFNVLYITMEMAEEEIGRRFDVNLLDIDFDTLELLSKDTFNSKFSKISNASFGKLVIKEYPTGGASAANFRSLLSELKTKQNFVPDMIVVDYMSICSSDIYKNSSSQNSYTIIGSIGKELRALATEYNCSIITAVQTTRSGAANSDVDITHTSESFGIPAIADFFVAIINTDQLKDLSQLLFKQLKNRYSGLSTNEKFLMGVDYLKQTLFSLDIPSDMPNIKNKKDSPLNKKLSNFNNTLDMLHQIKPETSSFENFNFD